ncbi:MAG: gamma-glutamylcyclotransferase family protein [Candidatus Binatia bacterium]
MSDYLFVYGTLRRDASNTAHPLLSEHANFVSTGTYQGRLYDLGRYPGAVSSDHSSDVVQGELYALGNQEDFLKRLDEYEGSQFRRTEVSVLLDNGERVVTWIYIYDGATNGLKTIPSGDYVELPKR